MHVSSLGMNGWWTALPALLILPPTLLRDERAAKGQQDQHHLQAIPSSLIFLLMLSGKTYRDGGCHAGVPGDLEEAALVVEQTHGV